MNIFLSYASARRDVALRLKLALEAEGHDLFFDRDDLGAGEPFHEAIRSAVQVADLMIFLVSPESVRPGSYTRAELDVAQQLHPRPAGRVLPVVVAATPKADIPPYLLAVTLLEPPGDVVAGTLAAVARLAPRRRVWLWGGAAAALVLAVALGLGWRHVQAQRAAEHAAADAARKAQQAQAALAQCETGTRTDALLELVRLASDAGAPVAVHEAHEACAMRGLRDARISGPGSSFAAYVAPLRAVLVAGLARGAAGVHAADLHAHLGWADGLVWRDQRDPGIDPVPRYRQALALDGGNSFAHAMWAHWTFLRPRNDRALDDEAAKRFGAALAGGRDRAFVRVLQFGAYLGPEDLGPRGFAVLDDMRRGNEAVPAELKPRLWSRLFASPWYPATARHLREALPPEAMLATFTWLFPPGSMAPAQQGHWRYLHALLLTQAGRGALARDDLLALQRELRTDKSSGPFPDGVNQLAAQLR